MQYYYWLIIGILFLLNGCYTVGYEDFVNRRNNDIGQKTSFIEPFKFKDAGKLRRGDFQITGQGITVTKNQDGDLVVHWDSSEILPNYYNKKWVGKCLIYEIVDPKTHIIKSWGFDKGGNPLSCRTWP